MTAEELRSHFNKVFGIEKEWPKTYEVDAVTYANCCQDLFNWMAKYKEQAPYVINYENVIFLPCALRRENNGLMFKGVELILKS